MSTKKTSKWVPLMVPIETRDHFKALIGDTKRPIHDFLSEAMLIRETLKAKGKLEAFLEGMKKPG